MHWLIQNKFDYDPKVRELFSNLKRLGVPYTRASVIPFSTDGFQFENELSVAEANKAGLDSEIIEIIESQCFIKSANDLSNNSVFIYGSYTMAKNATNVFTPGAFVSPLISMTALTEHYGTEMLNYDMIVGKIKDLNPDLDKFFIRPVEDTKSIVGEEYNKEYFIKWKQKIIDANLEFPENYSTITPDTLMCIAPCKQIEAEYRCFVVNERVVTASQYKMQRMPYFVSYVDDYIIDYVNSIVKTWQPDKAFVLDVALSNGKLYIIEANCINSSGLYKIDTQKLIMAVDEL